MASVLDRSYPVDLYDFLQGLEYYKEKYRGKVSVVIDGPDDDEGNAMLCFHFSHWCGNSQHQRHYDSSYVPMGKRAVQKLPEVLEELLYSAIDKSDGWCRECRQAAGLQA